MDYQSGRQMEACNRPLVLVAGVEKWPAMLLWDPARGGLNHLKSLAGSMIVQAITSKSGSAFYGHIKGHDRVKLGSAILQFCLSARSLVAISFGSFIDHIMFGSETGTECDVLGRENPDVNSTLIGSGEMHIGIQGKESSTHRASDSQLYLAQVPIFSKEAVGEMTLSPLMQDIMWPPFLKAERISSINLWMSMNNSRSSTHYDPYHNLLCVVAGEKRVTLWPPSAAPYLYPLPIHGEASNHSGVDFVEPDYSAHPLFKEAPSVAKQFTLRPGDALFIPEGWYHQVDSMGVTLGVNFWWPSKVSLALGTHMDAYFLRRIIVNLVDSEKDRMLRDETTNNTEQNDSDALFSVAEAGSSTSRNMSGQQSHSHIFQDSTSQYHGLPSNLAGQDHGGNIRRTVEGPPQLKCGNTSQNQSTGEEAACNARSAKTGKELLKLDDLTVYEIHYLKRLIDIVSAKATNLRCTASKSCYSSRGLHEASTDNISDAQQEHSKDISEHSISNENYEDSAAGVFSALKPCSLQRILLVMVNQFPRMLYALMMTSLSPAAAELLTRRFEEMDASAETDSQLEFYTHFYGAFDHPETVMEALLDGKEAFGEQALRNVMTRFLGLSCSYPR